jgi:hypothetical protein
MMIDPVTMARLAEIRQQEFLEMTAYQEYMGTAVYDESRGRLRQLVSQVGGVLVRVGQKMTQADGSAYEAQSAPSTATTENC